MRVVVRQVETSSNPQEVVSHASRGPRPPGAEKPTSFLRREGCACERMGLWGGREQRKGGDTVKPQLPKLVRDRSSFQPRRMGPRWFAKRTFTQRTHSQIPLLLSMAY